jgi:hypothetical protein
MNAQFLDPNGNQLPAGVRVQVFSGSNTLGSLVLDQFLGYGATTTGSLLATSTTYTASFIGTQAPSNATTFTTPASSGATASVTITGYHSPDLTQANIAVAEAALWPRGWFSSSAMTSGGVAYNVAYAAAWALQQIDEQHQIVTEMMRLQSSIGQDIDTWAYDFFGNNLPRNAGESDSAYITRIQTMLAIKQSTPAGLNTVANLFGTAWINEPWRTAETGAWDTNGVFAWDSVGGWGGQSPLIQVYVKPNAGVNATTMKNDIVSARGIGIVTTVNALSSSPVSANPSSLSFASVSSSGQTSTISGGISPYSIITHPNLAVATATISSNIVTVTPNPSGAPGSSMVAVSDSSGNVATISISVA